MACDFGELHAICFLWTHVFYVLIMPFLRLITDSVAKSVSE